MMVFLVFFESFDRTVAEPISFIIFINMQKIVTTHLLFSIIKTLNLIFYF